MSMIRVVSFSLALSLAAHGVAWACSCVAPAPVPEAADEADLVVFGEVTSIQAASRGCRGRVVSSTDPLNVTIEVIEGYVGAADGDEVEVETASSSASCGVEFVEGDLWLVYATDGSASLCSRTREVTAEDPELDELRALTAAE